MNRHTVNTITSDALDALYDELAALRRVSRGYCPACGRGDAAPTGADWEQQKQRADQAERERDGISRMHLTAMSNLGIATHRLDQINDAARLHRQTLIGTSELYAVIEAEHGTACSTSPEHAVPEFKAATETLNTRADQAIALLHEILYAPHITGDRITRWRGTLDQLTDNQP